MQFYNVIENRKSIKSYVNAPVDNIKLSRMIKAAMMAPTWKNNSDFKIILVDDFDKKNSLADSIRNKTEQAANSLRQAPLAAVFTSDPNASGIEDGKEYYLADASIAMEHFVLAATEEGYGTCWIASFDESLVQQTLQIPQSQRVVAMTPIGLPGSISEHHPPKDAADYVFLNRWNSPYNV